MDQKKEAIIELLQPDLKETKELFDAVKPQIEKSKDLMINYIKQTNNSAIYYINLIETLTCIRPDSIGSNVFELIKQLVQAVNTCFPKIPQEIDRLIKFENYAIKYAINLDTKYPVQSGYQYQNELFPILQKDDSNSLNAYLEKDKQFDINGINLLTLSIYYYHLFDSSHGVTILDFCCYYGSVNCFNNLLSKNCEITEQTLKWAIAGGNRDIISILSQKGHTFEKFLETSVKYHRYELTKWIFESYKCERITLQKCLDY